MKETIDVEDGHTHALRNDIFWQIKFAYRPALMRGHPDPDRSRSPRVRGSRHASSQFLSARRDFSLTFPCHFSQYPPDRCTDLARGSGHARSPLAAVGPCFAGQRDHQRAADPRFVARLVARHLAVVLARRVRSRYGNLYDLADANESRGAKKWEWE